MVRSGPSVGPCCRYLPTASLLLLLVLVGSAQDSGVRTRLQETVTVNVTTLHGAEKVTEQVSSNISYIRGRIHLNGFPVNRGVSRISCRMVITCATGIDGNWLLVCKSIAFKLTFDESEQLPLNCMVLTSKGLRKRKNGDYNTSGDAHNALVSVRLLVLHNLLNYSRTSITVQQEVIAIGGNKVNQSEIAEVKLEVNRHMEILHYSSSTMNLEDSHLYSISWDNDVLVTFPNIPESAADSVPQQTTREYGIGQNTTVDEEPFPGKLPETPIRAVIPASSYKVMCEFADELRDKLCLIWSWLYPVLANIAQVLIVGVIGAAIVLELLKIFLPLKEPNWTLQSIDFKDFPLLVPLILSGSDKKEAPQEAGNIS